MQSRWCCQDDVKRICSLLFQMSGREDECVVCYFGDGAASGLKSEITLKWNEVNLLVLGWVRGRFSCCSQLCCHVERTMFDLMMTSFLPISGLFICRNNGFAISTPVSEQFNGDPYPPSHHHPSPSYHPHIIMMKWHNMVGDGIISRASGYGIHGIRLGFHLVT